MRQNLTAPKVIIHAGMPKTGSTSIQEHFYKTRYPGLTYARSTGSNHGFLYSLLFEDPKELASRPSFKRRGKDFCETLPGLREEWHASLTEDMNALGDNTILFSAELISFAQHRSANFRMSEFFRRWTKGHLE